MSLKAANGGAPNGFCCADEVSVAPWLVELSDCASISITCSIGLLLVELVLSAELELSEDEASVEDAGVVSATVEPSA